jgi:hypothetical protein
MRELRHLQPDLMLELLLDPLHSFMEIQLRPWDLELANGRRTHPDTSGSSSLLQMLRPIMVGCNFQSARMREQGPLFNMLGKM